MLAKAFEPHDLTCRYVRDMGEHWEYGVVKKERSANRRLKEGEAKTFEEACEKGWIQCSGKSSDQ